MTYQHENNNLIQIFKATRVWLKLVPKWRPNNATYGWIYFSSSLESPKALLTNYNSYKYGAEKNVGINNLYYISLISLEVSQHTCMMTQLLHVEY